MVVFIDLDEAEDPSADPLKSAGFALPRRQRFTNSSTIACADAEDQGDPKAERPNLNLNTLSEALGCYPSVPPPQHDLNLTLVQTVSSPSWPVTSTSTLSTISRAPAARSAPTSSRTAIVSRSRPYAAPTSPATRTSSLAPLAPSLVQDGTRAGDRKIA